MKPRHPFLSEAIHIFVLAGFAVAQPFFDLLGRNPEFFVAHRSQPLDIVLLALALSFIGPALLVLIEHGLHLLHPIGGRWTHFFWVAGLAGLTFLPVLKRFEAKIAAPVLLVGAALIGIGWALAYAKWSQVRTFLSLLSPAIFIFPSGFLLSPGISKIILRQSVADAAYVSPSVRTTTPVVWVIFDELALTSLMNQNREIDAHLFPNFSALAKESTWFRNATTVADSTRYAVPAILTGRHPDPARLPIQADYPDSIFSLLRGSHDFHAIEPITALCPISWCYTTPQPFLHRIQNLRSDLSRIYPHIVLPDSLLRNLPAVTNTWKNFKEGNGFNLRQNAREARGNILEDFEHLLDTIRPKTSGSFTNRPGFYFMHSVLPHVPWDYLPSGRQYGSSRRITYYAEEQWVDDVTRVTQGYQRHLLQVGYVDTLLERLVTRLKAAGIYDSALLVIAADHGVSFKPNGQRRAITEENHRDIMSVPLFIRAPHQRQGAISDRNVETVDILPTVAEVLGIPLPWPTDGRSVFDSSVPERETKIIFANRTRQRHVYDANPDARNVALEHKLALFKSESGEEGLFQIGPYPDLIGRASNRLLSAASVDVRVLLDDRDRYRQVDPASSFVPAQITGQLLPMRANHLTPYDLAVAINGTIRATTRSFQMNDGKVLFSAIVPEGAFHPGENSVEVFAILPTDSGRIVRIQPHATFGGVSDGEGA